MLSVSAFLLAMIPLYVTAFIGFLGKRKGILDSHANGVITQLMLYITLPALILYSLDTTFSVHLMTEFIWLVCMSLFVLNISIFVGLLLRRKAKLKDSQKIVYESLIIFGNQGFIGFAIIFILLGEQGVIYLTFFNICYLILIWTYGIYLFTKNNKSVNWKNLFFNPGILSTVVGVCVLFLPFQWPNFLLETFESVGKMTIPLSMLLIGSLLADINWHDLKQYSKNIYLWIAACCKLIILPLFLLVFLPFQVPYALLLVAVLTSAMPSAATTSLYAQKYGGDPSFASYGVLLTTLLCLFSIPLLYSLLQFLYPYFYL